TDTVTRGCLAGRNPVSSAVTSYTPGSRLPTRYTPTSFDTVVRDTPVVRLVIVTDAPGTTLRVWSVIVPWMAPSCCWASPDDASRATIVAAAGSNRRVRC